MKKFTTLVFILLSITVLKAQHYIENVAFDSTLLIGQHSNSSNCLQPMSTKIELDAPLYTYVTGLEFVIIIDSVHFGGPMGISPIHPGDTITLNSSSPVFTLPSSYNGEFWFKIKVIGTPTVANQNYPCQIEILQCTCFCTDIIIRKSSVNTNTCSVDISNTIIEIERPAYLKIFPNPVNNKLIISNVDKKTNIQISDALGKLIIQKDIYSQFEYDTSNLPDGIYSLTIFNESKGSTSQKLLVQNN